MKFPVLKLSFAVVFPVGFRWQIASEIPREILSDAMYTSVHLPQQAEG